MPLAGLALLAASQGYSSTQHYQNGHDNRDGLGQKKPILREKFQRRAPFQLYKYYNIIPRHCSGHSRGSDQTVTGVCLRSPVPLQSASWRPGRMMAQRDSAKLDRPITLPRSTTLTQSELPLTGQLTIVCQFDPYIAL